MQIFDSPIGALFGRLSNAILLAIFCLPMLTSCGSQKIIVNGLEEREANEIVVLLASKGINAAKVRAVEAGGGGGSKVILFDIAVDSDEVNEAMSMLNQAGLPRKKGVSLLGIFSNTGSLVPSDMQEQIRYQAGLAESIASTIRKIDGVLDSEVNISFPKQDPLNPEKTKGKITASVYVKHTGVLDDPNSHLITKIKRLVAASVTGLDYDNVTVIGDRARYSDTSLGPPGGISEEEKQYVSIWSLIIAKESVTRFRIIFFSLCAIVLLLILALTWIGWKFYPLLQKHGGIKQIFHLQPLEEGEPQKEEKPEEEAKEEKKETGNEKGLVDKDVDET